MEGDQAGQTHALGQAAVVVVLVPRAVAQPGLVPAAGEVVQVEVVNERNVRNCPNRTLVLKIPLNLCRIHDLREVTLGHFLCSLSDPISRNAPPALFGRS